MPEHLRLHRWAAGTRRMPKHLPLRLWAGWRWAPTSYIRALARTHTHPHTLKVGPNDPTNTAGVGYWYNTLTEESTWVLPDKIVACAVAAEAATAQQYQPSGCKDSGIWETHFDAESGCYFRLHSGTGESVWEDGALGDGDGNSGAQPADEKFVTRPTTAPDVVGDLKQAHHHLDVYNNMRLGSASRHMDERAVNPRTRKRRPVTANAAEKQGRGRRHGEHRREGRHGGHGTRKSAAQQVVDVMVAAQPPFASELTPPAPTLRSG